MLTKAQSETNRLRIAVMALTLLLLANRTDASEDESTATSFLSVQQITQDVTLAKEAYERLHPGYTRYAKPEQMNQAWDEIITLASEQQGMSLGQFYLAIQKTLTLIRCDHTKANLPAPLLLERDETPVYLPFRWEWIDNRAFVTLPVEGLALERMEEILAIDDTPIGQLVDRVLPYIPYDGMTEWSRLSGVTESLEFKGGAIDHFGAFLWEVSPQVRLTVRGLTGEVRSLNAGRVNHKQWTQLENGANQASNFKDAVTFKRIGERRAYLRIDTFVNYRDPVSPAEVYDPVFKALRDEKRDILILDLRNNGGGSTDASMGLLSNLILKPTRAKKDMRAKTLDLDGLREHLWTWDERAMDPWRLAFSKNDDDTYSLRSWFTDDLDTIKPARYAFSGKVIALTGPANSSGSTNLLSNIQDAGRAVLVGEKTGGSAEGPTAGLLFTLTLPASKITTRIPYFRYYNNISSFKEGMGVVPDIEARMTAEAFLQGQDPALMKATGLLSYRE